jgi:hypothetical protein
LIGRPKGKKESKGDNKSDKTTSSSSSSGSKTSGGSKSRGKGSKRGKNNGNENDDDDGDLEEVDPMENSLWARLLFAVILLIFASFLAMLTLEHGTMARIASKGRTLILTGKFDMASD